MGDAFKDHIFPKYEEKRVMKPQMKGFIRPDAQELLAA